nr:type II secretion system protein GspM [uncultured Undibacterium sp.]
MKQMSFFNELLDHWNRRELRERRILLAVGLLVIVSMVYLIGVQPAMSNIKNLREYTPKLKQQAASMNMMAEQYSQLSKTMTESVPLVSRESIEASLARRNIKTQSLTVVNDAVRFQVNVVAYANLMEWMLEMQRATRLTVDDIKLTALSEPGQVSVVVSLRQQRVNN